MVRKKRRHLVQGCGLLVGRAYGQPGTTQFHQYTAVTTIANMRVFVNCGAATVLHSISADATFRELSKQLAPKLSLGLSRHDLWFQHSGRRCQEEQSLGAAGVAEGSFVQAHLRLRGGGGDGGATGAESRSSYLEMYMEKKPDKVDPAEEKLARATTCKLSGQRLEPPCVVDELGSLYNKEAVVSALVSKTMPKALGHISSLKHVRDVTLKQNEDTGTAFCCPISGQALNGQHRFCVLLPSGHVVSEKALAQVAAAVEELVGGKYDESLPLNGSKEEVEALWDKLIANRAAMKKLKREKKVPGAAVKKASSGVSTKAAKSKSPGLDESPPSKPDAGVKRQIQDFTLQERIAAKKIRVADMAPAHANERVWASLFTSTHGPQAKETYSCRSTSARGWI